MEKFSAETQRHDLLEALVAQGFSRDAVKHLSTANLEIIVKAHSAQHTSKG